jgi:anaerobic ribonucleoside-triphosphate reductase
MDGIDATLKPRQDVKLALAMVQKRDGRIVAFDQKRIDAAIDRAFRATGQARTSDRASALGQQVADRLLALHGPRGCPDVEQIQDVVEEVLILAGEVRVAKAYILYRYQRKEVRDTSKLMLDGMKLVDDYVDRSDWRVNENANMNYSLQGLNHYIASSIAAKYWLNKVYPAEVRRSHVDGDFHIHDLGMLATYCCGWDLQDLLQRGFGGVRAKLESKPPKHLRTALGQLVNFFYTVQGESAGAQAISSFDSLLAPFVRYDRLSYSGVKQALQEFVFNINVPTRVGFQTPFTNITLDLTPPPTLAHQPVIIGGKPQAETYSDFQQEMDWINRAFAEVLLEGDAKGRVFTFPIPTYNVTSDFDWDNPVLEPVWQVTAKYGIPYFANYINSDMKPEDARSMCCRLRLDNRELRKRGGGLFGANPLTGSIGVVTLNLARIGYRATSEADFFYCLNQMMERAKTSLEIKRKVLVRHTEQGLYPYSRHYLQAVCDRMGSYWGNHFSTIGIVGMNECCLNFLDVGIGHPHGHQFALQVLQFMRSRLADFQEATGHLYNLEATPAESASYRLARADRKQYSDIITAGTRETPYYTNSTHLPVGFSDDLFAALRHQDDLQTSYTGGTVFHAFLGERIDDWRQARLLVRRIAERFRLPYFTLTPTFSVCPVHGYISGEHRWCPYEHSRAELQRFGVVAPAMAEDP